jgi:glycine reductase
MSEVSRPISVVHCVNQFFGGLGGEEAADQPPVWLDGAQGPGHLIEQLAPDFQIAGTIVFGDNYVAENLERAVTEILALLRERLEAQDPLRVELIITGPAFHAGRYGLACGAICRAVGDVLNLPAIAAMYPENPGVDAYRRDAVIVPTARDVMGMREAVERLVRVGRRLALGEAPDPEGDETLRETRRRNRFASSSGAERAVEMLLSKLRGEPLRSECPMPAFERIPAAPPLSDPGSARIALVTTGGIVPTGNPDRIESANARRWGSYDIRGLDAVSPATHQSAHGGYDPTYANEDPNRVLPLDVARALEREGRIGRLHDRYYATVGNATDVAQARRFGQEIVARLLTDGVQAVILTST